MDTQISNSPPFSGYLLVWESISLLPFSDTIFGIYNADNYTYYVRPNAQSANSHITFTG